MEVCHSSDQSNVTSYAATVMAIIMCEVFAGTWITAFLVFVLCVAWVKKKTLKSHGKILLLLGCSRFWNLCFAWVNSFLAIFYPNYLFVHHMVQLAHSVQSFFECSNSWVSAFLCLFYCIKIANFRNSFFIYLKIKVGRMVAWLLLGSVHFSLLIGILVYNITGKALYKNFNLTCQGMISKGSIRIEEHFLSDYFLIVFVFATAFMAVIFSALLLLFSLWRHKHNMQTNSMKDVSMDAHIKAIKTILSLVMYSINFTSLILILVYSMNNETDMMFPIRLIQYVFPGLHSLILIFSNPKLAKILLKILPCVKCKERMKQDQLENQKPLQNVDISLKKTIQLTSNVTLPPMQKIQRFIFGAKNM